MKDVLQQMPAMGGKVIDSAQAYGNSEEVIGKLLAELGNRDKFFLATKTPLGGDVSGGAAVLENSFRRLQVSKIDLLQIHNVHGLDELMPLFLDYKKAGKVRYIGVTTSVDAQYEAMMAAMKKYPFDFIQVDYSSAIAARGPGAAAGKGQGHGRAQQCAFRWPRPQFLPEGRWQAGAGFRKGIRRNDLGAVLPQVQRVAPGDHCGDSRHDDACLPGGQPAGRSRSPAQRRDAQADSEEFWDAT